MVIILLVILVVLALGGLPTWGYHSYGYAPTGLLGLVLIVLLILFLMGRLWEAMREAFRVMGWVIAIGLITLFLALCVALIMLLYVYGE